MINARLVLHSINPAGVDISTWLLTYPRFIHSEFMTHRCFSRNAASSRAIPITKMMDAVFENPAFPVRYGTKGKGMQDGGVMSEYEAAHVKDIIEAACNDALGYVKALDQIGCAKQIANRYIEPWMHMTVLATTTRTGLMNFFALRAHAAADPTFQVLAYSMLGEYIHSTPHSLNWGDWHLPGVNLEVGIKGEHTLQNQLKMSTALAARASYIAFDEPLTMERAIDIHDNKLMGPPMHGSPFEHSAQAISVEAGTMGLFSHYPWSNFDTGFKPSGWGQYRKLFSKECADLDNDQLHEIYGNMEMWVLDAIAKQSK